jgi:signal transduction histidine kinase
LITIDDEHRPGVRRSTIDPLFPRHRSPRDGVLEKIVPSWDRFRCSTLWPWFAQLERQFMNDENDALRERLARAEASNRAKDEFFAVLSHELRSPLNAMSMWVHLLRRGMLDTQKAAHALDVIDRAIALQVRLINDLVDISRIRAGKLVVENRWLDLAAVAKEAAELLRGNAQAKGLTFEVCIEPRRMPVRGDRGRLQQIVNNLLSNSIKFTPAGGRVELDVRVVDSSASIVVRDTGIGIDEGRGDTAGSA